MKKAKKVTGALTIKPKSETVTITKQKLQKMQDEIAGLKATLDLLSNPQTARRVRAALKQANAGKLKEFDL
jgi:PHD/YefM family antitoxin component YafN of YafNO toxin-antitoxin module